MTSSPALSHISSDSGIISRSPSPASSTDTTCYTPQQHSTPATLNRQRVYSSGASPLLTASGHYDKNHAETSGLWTKTAGTTRCQKDEKSSVPQRKGLKRKLSVSSIGSEVDDSEGDRCHNNDESHDSLLEEPKQKYMRPWEDSRENMQSAKKIKKEGHNTESKMEEMAKGSLGKNKTDGQNIASSIKEKKSDNIDTKVSKLSPADALTCKTERMTNQKYQQKTQNILVKDQSTLSLADHHMAQVKMAQQYQHHAMMSQMWQQKHQYPQGYSTPQGLLSPYMTQLGLTSAYQQQQYNAAVQTAAKYGHSFYSVPKYNFKGELASNGRAGAPLVHGLCNLAGNEDFLTRGRLNSKATEVLNDWYSKNLADPYPTNTEAKKIAQTGGISMAQVRKWMANKRVRSGNTVKVNKSLKCKQGIKQIDEGYFKREKAVPNMVYICK